MTEEMKKNEPKKKMLQMNNRLGGMKMWWAIMAVYFMIFCIIGYIAFMPMSFNDPDNTVKKYLDILHDYQAKTKTSTQAQTQDPVVEDTLQLAMEELMKEAEESANDMQELASQSFNIVLGAFLAFLSATAAMLFQGSSKEKKPEQGKKKKLGS